MRAGLGVLLAGLISMFADKPLPAQPKPSVPCDTRTTIADAEISQDGSVAISLGDGRRIRVAIDKGQAGRERLQIAGNGCSAGWLEDDTPVGSYSVPTTLTVYTVGRPIQHFGDGLMLIDWDFKDADKHIQFSSSQAHGPGTAWLSIEVHDLDTGRLLKKWTEVSRLAETPVALATVSGRLTNGLGAALPDTVVSIGAGSLDVVALALSGEDGHFTLPGILPGEHLLRFEHPGFKARSVKFTADPSGEPADVGVVTLERQPAQRK